MLWVSENRALVLNRTLCVLVSLLVKIFKLKLKSAMHALYITLLSLWPKVGVNLLGLYGLCTLFKIQKFGLKI